MRSIGLALLAWVAVGCGGEAPRAPRLVLLYAPCSVSKHYLAPYDDTVSYTPSLARFARGARVFGAHQTEAGQSGIAYASLFSGTQATRHGVFGHPAHIGDAVPLIFESFRAAGYDVFFWNRHPMASAELGYARGVPPEHVFPRLLKGSDPALQALLSELASDPSRRALVVTNFHVSHHPYPNRIAAFRERFPQAYAEASAGLTEADVTRYEALHREHPELHRDFPAARARLGLSDAELAKLIRVVELLYVSDIAHLDQLFGSVVDAVERRGLLDESAIAFTADHGEVLFRENALFQWTHGFQLAPEVLGVPLLLRAPGVAAGRADFVTRSIDVFPTLAGLAGVPIEPGRVEGVDLSGFLRGAEPAPTLLAYSHTSKVRSDLVRRAQRSWSLFANLFPTTDVELVWVALREGDRVYKLRNTGNGRFGFELFDLARDPSETHDRFDPGDPLQRDRAKRLEAYKAELVAREHAAAALPELTRAQVESMRSLGYVE